VGLTGKKQQLIVHDNSKPLHDQGIINS